MFFVATSTEEDECGAYNSSPPSGADTGSCVDMLRPPARHVGQHDAPYRACRVDVVTKLSFFFFFFSRFAVWLSLHWTSSFRLCSSGDIAQPSIGGCVHARVSLCFPIGQVFLRHAPDRSCPAAPAVIVAQHSRPSAPRTLHIRAMSGHRADVCAWKNTTQTSSIRNCTAHSQLVRCRIRRLFSADRLLRGKNAEAVSIIKPLRPEKLLQASERHQQNRLSNQKDTSGTLLPATAAEGAHGSVPPQDGTTSGR
ncbi:hypothetical protein FN846DRAFT_651965 [Sphaerosporella brunnea]|uniref:Uncharacterized protein n=1 Tax=Sphaerosporella brunnea TaxID=1250544 RepID=A0A5J5EBJ5_9PEZI|nr:hypothetical protein FN846DRAFT_651965 [Sphaerosporella brunnea]